ncbi:MAG: acetylxylan esterase [Rhodopirellula sp.]|mgnify:CR=1 FL=1|nr:acetylxylan esterase [Rhodopirellula sp.]
MRKLRLPFCLLFILFALASHLLAAEPPFAVSVATERPDALYEIGDEVRFLIQARQGDKPVTVGEVRYTLNEDGVNPLGSGTVELTDTAAAVSGRMDKPGFLRCQVTWQPEGGKPLTALAGAAISPTKIVPSLPVPDDFDAFWADQKAKLAQMPIDPKLTPVDSPEAGIECFDVQVPCLGGAPVSGYFARPKGAQPKSLPVILWVHGAGVRSATLYAAVNGAKQGMLSMDINAHGIPNGKPPKYYEELSAGELKDYRFRGRESRQTVYFLGMFLRLVRAIDFLTTQPEWNGKVVAVIGHSQGGGQALAAGGLDSRVTVIAAGVPAICDHTGQAVGRINGWPKLVPNGADGKPEPAALEASRYVDAVNLASRCKADAIVSVGFIDVTCPATTCYAAYNQLQGKKRVINEPQMGHAAPAHIQEAFLDWIRAHVKANVAQ